MLIDGRAIAQDILDALAKRVHLLRKDFDVIPHLAVIRIGNDAATSSYIAQKEKLAKKIGAYVSVYNFPDDITEEKLLESIGFLQEKGDIHGIILQLPLPLHLDANKLLLAIDPAKDIDGFHPKSKFQVPLALAVMDILQYVYEYDEKNPDTSVSFHQWLKSKNIVVIGKGKSGGASIIAYLHGMGIKPTIVDSKTLNPWDSMKKADILISAVGKRHIIAVHDIKKDAVLIGVGMGKDAEGNFFGDYDTNEIKTKAAYYTPIPGGVGPVNVAKLLENLVTATENSLKIN